MLKRLTTLAHDPLAPATIIVTHHIEEIPIGTTHALLLADGETIAQGTIETVLTSENLTQAYAIPVAVNNEMGRYFARAL